jgi:hypothetical protein
MCSCQASITDQVRDLLAARRVTTSQVQAVIRALRAERQDLLAEMLAEVLLCRGLGIRAPWSREDFLVEVRRVERQEVNHAD